ncbi:hypothetical protein HY522_02365, partial [bacterium]|nr:hypothetical protein [bacterium]
MLSFSEAQEILKANIPKPKVVRLPLIKAADYCLAADVKGDSDIPTVDNSALDGFAVRFDDVNTDLSLEPTKLKIVGTVRAGQMPGRTLGAGEALRIMTGAPIPKGVDAVIPIEETRE